MLVCSAYQTPPGKLRDDFWKQGMAMWDAMNGVGLRSVYASCTFATPALIETAKKNPSSAMYTSLGVITKGTVIEVNVSELGLVTTTGRVVWGKYAQVTNDPELDGCINAVLLV